MTKVDELQKLKQALADANEKSERLTDKLQLLECEHEHFTADNAEFLARYGGVSVNAFYVKVIIYHDALAFALPYGVTFNEFATMHPEHKGTPFLLASIQYNDLLHQLGETRKEIADVNTHKHTLNIKIKEIEDYFNQLQVNINEQQEREKELQMFNQLNS